MSYIFSENGYTVIPSGEEAKHLIRGANKPIPILVLIAALIDAGFDFVRMISFGMKQKLDTFPLFSLSVFKMLIVHCHERQFPK